MGFLNQPSYYPSFHFPFSISSTLHLFPTHDDTFLLTYPIKLFLLPIITTMPSPRQQFLVYNPFQQQHVVYNPIQQQPLVYSPSQQQPLVHSPSYQQFVVYNPIQQQPVVYSSFPEDVSVLPSLRT